MLPKASFSWLLMVTTLLLLAVTLPPEHVLAKRVPMGHPSLFVTLYAGSDPRFDFVIVENVDTIETLKAEIDTKLYRIFDAIVLPEIRKEFVENADIYSNGYVESIRAYLDMNESTLDILIERIPEEYRCSEGCAHRKVSVDIPAELQLSHFNNIGFSIAVYEQVDSGGVYDQWVERIAMKASTEAKFLFSEGANVFETNKETLLENGSIIEHVLLRQYEDISRITVLFLPSEAGVASSARKPIDVVITSNSYYERYWSSSLSSPSEQQSQAEPASELLLLQECEELDIDERDCTDDAIARRLAQERVRDQLPLSDEERKEMEEQRNQINNSMYITGIGAAIAGVIAFITLRRAVK